MKLTFSYLLVYAFTIAQAQTPVKLYSWNLDNFGSHKTDEQMKYIAKKFEALDVVAIIEVNAGETGPKGVEILNGILNKDSEERNYKMSGPTSTTGHGSERYALFWRIFYSAGDFNYPSKAQADMKKGKKVNTEAFDPLLSKGYASAFTDQRTSLKQTCPTNKTCLLSVYDNVFYKKSKVKIIKTEVLEFY